jgi:hypothetical protein
MEELAWRYHPEFNLSVLINGQPAGDSIEVVAAPSSEKIIDNYGLLIRSVPGGAMAYVRQKLSGVNWVAAVDLTQSIKISFWLMVRQGADIAFLDFFEQGAQRFGRQILYTDNLSAAGVIDANLVGDVVSLTAAASAGNTERGALSNELLSTAIVPGDYTMIRAGKIVAGAAVSFPVTATIAATESNVSLDFRQQDKGAYVIRLEGAVPVQEHVMIDEKASGSELCGVIDIHKNAWQLAAQPREYRINFSST